MSNTKKINAFMVADYFIDKSNKENRPITNKKLQKLLYYSQVWSMVLNDEKLFPERIEAWIHGPSIPSVYRRYRNFEFNPIKIDTSSILFSFSKKQFDLLNNVWSVYGKYGAEYLQALSHSELPWQEARKDLSSSEASNNIISMSLAKKFYAEKLASQSVKMDWK